MTTKSRTDKALEHAFNGVITESAIRKDQSCDSWVILRKGFTQDGLNLVFFVEEFVTEL